MRGEAGQGVVKPRALEEAGWSVVSTNHKAYPKELIENACLSHKVVVRVGSYWFVMHVVNYKLATGVYQLR